MTSYLILIKTFIENVKSNGLKSTIINLKRIKLPTLSMYTTEKEVMTIPKGLNNVNIKAIYIHKAIPLIVNNYMLRLLENYLEEIKTHYTEMYAGQNSHENNSKRRDELSQVVRDLSTNITVLEKAIETYEKEKVILTNYIRLSLGLREIKEIKVKKTK